MESVICRSPVLAVSGPEAITDTREPVKDTDRRAVLDSPIIDPTTQQEGAFNDTLAIR